VGKRKNETNIVIKITTTKAKRIFGYFIIVVKQFQIDIFEFLFALPDSFFLFLCCIWFVLKIEMKINKKINKQQFRKQICDVLIKISSNETMWNGPRTLKFNLFIYSVCQKVNLGVFECIQKSPNWMRVMKVD
jgi:hypothetical protein